MNAILAIFLISMILPFFGRTAISWIVDVTTVGATIAYALASGAAIRVARENGDKKNIVIGIIGLTLSILFALEFLIPNILSISTLSTESYLILTIWSILGFLYFRLFLRDDKERRMGHSSRTWIILLGLIVFASSVWLHQTTDAALKRSEAGILEYYEAEEAEADGLYISSQMRSINVTMDVASYIQIGLICFSLLILFRIYGILQKREEQIEIEKALAEESSRAKSSFLSNMSHEIRTPMNAIIGLDSLALRDPDLPPRTREYLEKIGASADHLLGLINDILDMSRIESGRMVLKNEEFSFSEFIDQINIIISGQCQEKGLHYECNIADGMSDYYCGDDMKLKQVMINILGNAVKFTGEGGSVTFNVEQLSETDGVCKLRFVMKDTGIGIDEEYLPKIFDRFSQEDSTNTNKYGGSGLGMAITRNFVEMMNGTVTVDSKKGEGSVFTVTVDLLKSDRSAAEDKASDTCYEEGFLAGKRVLMAEDVEQNAEILADILELEDVESEHAVNGKEAVRMFTESEEGYYDAILMDVRMPEMDGLTATSLIRRLDRSDAMYIPIIAMTANVFDEDIERSLMAGMNAHLSKPVEPDKLYETMIRLIKESGV